MRNSLGSAWARLRVYFGVLVLALFALGAGLIYASSLAEARHGRGETGLRAMGIEFMGLGVVSVVLAGWLKRRLSADD